MRSQNSRARFVSTKGINNLNQTTMETTEKNYVVNFEDAYASCIMLSVTFTLNGVNYEAKGDLLYGDIIENIEVLNVDTDEYIYDDEDEAYVLGDYLLSNMNVRKHLTC